MLGRSQITTTRDPCASLDIVSPITPKASLRQKMPSLFLVSAEEMQRHRDNVSEATATKDALINIQNKTSEPPLDPQQAAGHLTEV